MLNGDLYVSNDKCEPKLGSANHFQLPPNEGEAESEQQEYWHLVVHIWIWHATQPNWYHLSFMWSKRQCTGLDCTYRPLSGPDESNPVNGRPQSAPLTSHSAINHHQLVLFSWLIVDECSVQTSERLEIHELQQRIIQSAAEMMFYETWELRGWLRATH